jgi:hypothetical protein
MNPGYGTERAATRPCTKREHKGVYLRAADAVFPSRSSPGRRMSSSPTGSRASNNIVTNINNARIVTCISYPYDDDDDDDDDLLLVQQYRVN